MVKIKGYIEGVGCKHASIARLLGNWGIPAYTQEFTMPTWIRREVFANMGLNKIKRFVKQDGLVICISAQRIQSRK